MPSRSASRRKSASRRRKSASRSRSAAGYQMVVGSRAQVWHGTAHHTKSGLRKADLVMHEGRIKSRLRREQGLKRKAQFLRNCGHMTFRKHGRRGSRSGSRRSGSRRSGSRRSASRK